MKTRTTTTISATAATRATAAASRTTRTTRTARASRTTAAAAAAAVLLGAANLHAQSFQQIVNQFSVGARTGMESEFVYRGKEHSDANLQTHVTLELPVPMTTATYGISVFGKMFSMNPLTQTANQLDTSAGAKLEYESLKFEAGWIYHSFPNQNAHNYGLDGGDINPATNRAIYNRSHEAYVNIGAQISNTGTVVDGLRLDAYVYYDFNLQQTTVEADAGYSLSFAALPRFSINFLAYAGYCDAKAANADQRAASVPRWSNAYGYIGASADITYRIGEYATLGTGIRYAWNNDGVWRDARDEPRLIGNTTDNLWWGVWLRFAY
jgi:hypothetical protein